MTAHFISEVTFNWQNMAFAWIKEKKSTRSKIINILLLLVVLVGIYFVGNHFYQHYKVEQEVQATKTLTTKTVKKNAH